MSIRPLCLASASCMKETAISAYLKMRELQWDSYNRNPIRESTLGHLVNGIFLRGGHLKEHLSFLIGMRGSQAAMIVSRINAVRR